MQQDLGTNWDFLSYAYEAKWTYLTTYMHDVQFPIQIFPTIEEIHFVKTGSQWSINSDLPPLGR